MYTDLQHKRHIFYTYTCLGTEKGDFNDNRQYPLLPVLMDIYTTSFTYPRASAISVPPSTLDYASAAKPFGTVHHALSVATDAQAASNFAQQAEIVQKITLNAAQTHGCHVSFTKAGQGLGWNFHLSGAYQQVMAARGMILRGCPTQVRILCYR